MKKTLRLIATLLCVATMAIGNSSCENNTAKKSTNSQNNQETIKQNDITKSQQNTTVKFMDIPVDGPKEKFVQRLISKGFRNMEGEKDWYEGVVENRLTNLKVFSNNNKVFRIYSYDVVPLGEGDIISRYNREVTRLINSGEYELEYGGTISNNINLEKELWKNNGRIKSSFRLLTSKENYIGVLIAQTDNEYEYFIAFYYDNYNNAPADW